MNKTRTLFQRMIWEKLVLFIKSHIFLCLKVSVVTLLGIWNKESYGRLVNFAVATCVSIC